MTTKKHAGTLQVLDFVFWAQDPIKKNNLHGVLFKTQNIILLWCLAWDKSDFTQREPEMPIAAFALLQYLIVGVQVILSSLLPDRFEVKGSGNCAYLESKGVSASGCYLTRKWVCSLNINSAQWRWAKPPPLTLRALIWCLHRLCLYFGTWECVSAPTWRWMTFLVARILHPWRKPLIFKVSLQHLDKSFSCPIFPATAQL